MRANKLAFWMGFAAAMLAGGTAGMMMGSVPVNALDQPASEKEALKACEQRLCDIIVNKQPAGDDLSCALSKTWAQAKIKDGIEKRRMSWTFGDARCSVELSAKREIVLGAVTKPEHALELPQHTVKCEVERDKEITPINISLAPKITFKDGKAQKAWLNLKSIEGPAVVRGAIWTAAQIEDNFGLFHSDLIAEINEFIEHKCPKALAGK